MERHLPRLRKYVECFPRISVSILTCTQATKADASDDESDEASGSSDESSEDDKEEKEPAPKKRKAEEESVPSAKKSRVDDADSTVSANLFVGNLSWNVDETMLREHFETFGTLKGVRVMIDRQTGKAKG